jgi:phage-related minor tail protein
MATTTAAGVASATTLAAAYAPAAAAASLASYGANAAPAMTGIANTYALTGMLSVPKGFRTGGFTGNAGENEIAGVVHGGEYVFNAEAVRRIGVSQLEAMQSGDVGSRGSRSSAGGTFSADTPDSSGWPVLNVTIENYGTDKEFEVQQLSESDVRVIARDEARAVTREYAPGVIAAGLGDPNSTVSKSLGRNTWAERRR